MSSKEFNIYVSGTRSTHTKVDTQPDNGGNYHIYVSECGNVQIGEHNTFQHTASNDNAVRDEMQSLKNSSLPFVLDTTETINKSTENINLSEQTGDLPNTIQQSSSLPCVNKSRTSPVFPELRLRDAVGTLPPSNAIQQANRSSCQLGGSRGICPSRATTTEVPPQSSAMSTNSVIDVPTINVCLPSDMAVVDDARNSILKSDSCVGYASMIDDLLKLSTQCDVNTLDLFEEPEELAPFIGRQRERETIKRALCKKRRLIQIHGSMMVGKRRLVQKAIQEFMSEDQNIPGIITRHIPCKNLTSWNEYLHLFSQIFDLGTNEDMKYSIMYSKFREKFKNNSLILLLSNCEMFLSRKFTDQNNMFKESILSLHECFPSMQIVLTTQTCYDLDHLSQNIEIKRLNSNESLTLLQRSLPGIDAVPYGDIVIERCYGLPPLILDAATLVKRNAIFPITPHDLSHLLDDDVRWHRIHHQDVSHMSDFFPGLTEYLQQRIGDLSIFRDSFSVECLKDILPPGRFDADLLQDVNALFRSSVIIVVKEEEQVRLKIDPFVDALLRTVLRDHVKCNDVTRLKFVSFFGNVLTRANSELYITSQQTVYGYLQPDWLNLEQVLKEATHCSVNTFQVFYKVAINAVDLLIKCFPSEALNFYKVMECSAVKFGSPLELATLRGKLGRALTEIKETHDNLAKASLLFDEAEDMLVKSGPNHDLIAFYRDMSFHKFKRSQDQESFKYCRKALDTALQMDIDNTITNYIISIRARLAIILIVLRNYKEAENLLFETLELAHNHTPYHPAIYKMLNSLGNNYEYSGQDNALALKYYRASLIERRKYEAMVPGDLVVALNNVGRQYSKQGQYKHGLKYLKEAYRICKKVEKEDFNVGFTLFNMGSFHVALGNIDQAEQLLKQAIENFRICATTTAENVTIRLILGHCLIVKGDAKAARENLKEGSNYKQYFVKRTHAPMDSYLLVLGHMILFYRDDNKHLFNYLEEFTEEANRICNLEISASDKDNVIEIYKLACDYCQSLDKNSRFEIEDQFRHKLINMCVYCNQLRQCGYTCNELWIKASRLSATEMAIKNSLLKSPALNEATRRLESNERIPLSGQLCNGVGNRQLLQYCMNFNGVENGNHDIRKTSNESQCGVRDTLQESCREQFLGNLYPSAVHEINERVPERQGRVPTEATFPSESILSGNDLIPEKRHDNFALEDL